MPRTKRVKNVSLESMDKDILLKYIRDEAILRIPELDDPKLANLEADHETVTSMIKDKFKKYLNIRLSELTLINTTNASLLTSSCTKRGKIKLKRSLSDTTINKTNALSSQSSTKATSSASDSGNSTGSNMSTSTSRSGSSNRATKVIHTTAKARRSRSLSRNGKHGAPLTFGNARSTMRTPLMCQRLPIMTPITPKMKSCDVLPAVMRRPKHNEIAVSLQGSPLMVNALMDGINANIPLSDGRVIALQPQSMRFSEIADMSLEPESISDLQQLRDNLAKLCESVAAKSSKRK